MLIKNQLRPREKPRINAKLIKKAPRPIMGSRDKQSNIPAMQRIGATGLRQSKFIMGLTLSEMVSQGKTGVFLQEVAQDSLLTY